MHDLLASWGLTGWKPLITALLLPPVPWIVLVVWGARCLARRQRRGWWWTGIACLGLWASSSVAVGAWLEQALLKPPAMLQATSREALKRQAQQQPGSVAVVVLGGGREPWAPEFEAPSLNKWSLARLRYGVWLARQTGWPLAFSGGVGHAGAAGVSEAEVAARVAEEEFLHPLKWVETRSRDTRENAQEAVALLRAAGITHLVVVTDHWHMPRSMRAFERAVAESGGGLALTAAPMGTDDQEPTFVAQWMPSVGGFTRVRHVLREWLGLLAGA
jgi:uncharacterized SAM-binding protein YcdF (DUF218 family)